MLKIIKNNLMPFLAGIFFSLFILMVLFVVFLYNENSSMQREINDFQKKLADMEIKISTKTDPLSQKQAQPTGNNETKTYYVPKDVETVPYTGGSTGQTSDNFRSDDISKQNESNGATSGKDTYYIPNKVQTQAGNDSRITDETGMTSTSDAYDGTKKTYYAPNQVPSQTVDKTDSKGNNKDPNYNIESGVIRKEPVYTTSSWEKLKVNMTKNEVEKLLGIPSKVVSYIDSSSYIYSYDHGDGEVYFNRQMRVTGWAIP